MPDETPSAPAPTGGADRLVLTVEAVRAADAHPAAHGCNGTVNTSCFDEAE